jgi:hypothetical protein
VPVFERQFDIRELNFGSSFTASRALEKQEKIEKTRKKHFLSSIFSYFFCFFLFWGAAEGVIKQPKLV